jgi:predicted MFS family arabinose efflux permease
VIPTAALLLCTGALPVVAVTHRDERGWRGYRLRYGAVLAHRETRWLLGATLLFGAVWSGWFIYIGAYAIATFATSTAFLSALFLVAGVAEVLGSVATPRLLRYTTARVLTGIGLALTAFTLAALGVVFTRAWTLFAFIAIASGVGAVIYTTISVMALDAAPGAVGGAHAARCALLVDWGTGPAVAGAALAVFGDYRAGYRALGALSVLGIGCLAMGARRTRAVGEGVIEQHPT